MSMALVLDRVPRVRVRMAVAWALALVFGFGAVTLVRVATATLPVRPPLAMPGPPHGRQASRRARHVVQWPPSLLLPSRHQPERSGALM